MVSHIKKNPKSFFKDFIANEHVGRYLNYEDGVVMIGFMKKLWKQIKKNHNK